jgi:short subunit dehydrogenase-like uncharacterized protein
VSRLVLYGATGHTGRLVAAALQTVADTLVLAGRDRARLDALAGSLEGDVRVAVAPAHDEAALARAFEGAAVVVSCAGPFSQMGEPVVRAAIAAGADYLDSTGEQAFMREVYEHYESAARRRGVCVVNGHAFEIAVGDWAAARAAGRLGGDEPLDEIIVGYALDHMRPTRGTQLSVAESLSRGGVLWDHDRWRAVAPAAEARTLSFPELGERATVSFPSGEVITVPRHLEVRRVQTFISLGAGAAARLGAGGARLLGSALPALVASPLASYLRSRVGARRTAPPDRSATRFAIAARARRGFEEAQVAVSGGDPYALTAGLLRAAAVSLLARRPDRRPVGVLAPSQAFSPVELQRTLTEHGCRIFE